jgi:hypothetical protein
MYPQEAKIVQSNKPTSVTFVVVVVGACGLREHMCYKHHAGVWFIELVCTSTDGDLSI